MADSNRWENIAGMFAKVQISRQTYPKLLLVLSLIVALAAMFPRGEVVELEYKVGGVWAQKDLIAPFSFPIVRDENDYQAEVAHARQLAYPVFDRDTMAVQRQSAALDTFFSDLNRALSEFPASRSGRRVADVQQALDSSLIRRLSASVDVTLSDGEWGMLARLKAAGRLIRMKEVLSAAMKRYLQVGLLDRSKQAVGHSEAAVRLGTMEQIVPVGALYDLSDISDLLENSLAESYGGGGGEAELAYKLGITHILPNLVFNAQASELAIEAAVDAVPRTTGYVQENERIINKHDRITPEVKRKLDSFMRAKTDRGATADVPSQFLGAVFHVTIVVMLFGIYLSLFRKKIVGSLRRLGLIALLILIVGLVAYLTREIEVSAPVEYLIIVPAASMLLTIFFDSRVGFYGTVILAYLVAGIRGNDYSIALASLVAGALSVYTVRDMKDRAQIFRSLVFIFIGYSLSITALGLERYEPLSAVGEKMAFALGNAVISPVLTYGLLIFLERSFKLTTDLTLIELSQFNHPLLRMLAEKAPGTYHHSLNMATLAEAGAAAVNANVVLARVGAYFHDIGKVVKPTYFVENQRSSKSRHDKLAPRMSSLIIAAHVKEGIALAREYHVPEEVVDFIPMHHGTTRIDFFYNKALEMARHSEDETKIDEIKEQDYRYDGPRPNTKETGIMMLADAIEAAVRTIEEPTPQRIGDLVEELVKKRLEEGELDYCPLTMADLTAIKAAFVNVLVGFYHSRVRYPEAPKKRTRRTEESIPPDDLSGSAPETPGPADVGSTSA
jgi:putative nucleotidyltransferase with HDIG domain